MAAAANIREIRPNDDYEQIRDLIITARPPAMYFPSTEDSIRSWFFQKIDKQKPKRKGFVAETGQTIQAIMGLDVRDQYGVIVYAMRMPNDQLLAELVNKCEEAILKSGGRHLTYFAFTDFGQIRNPEITLLESVGFRASDEYMRISTRLKLQDWQAPEEDFHLEGIQPEDVGLDEIYRIMIDDGNVPNAVIFKHQFSSPDPSRVTLTLRNERQELMAIAYYKVKRVNPNSELLSATAFNLHFRPGYGLPRQERRRFLQGVLCSMKQLDLHTANSLMSLNQADVFTLMVREGFEQFESCFFALSKAVGPKA